tara:strand:+ start:252 stop:746 length:495 start_codon:yes stop_codon:yes gene_type:complete
VSDFNIFLDTDNELAFSLEIEGAEDSSVRSQFIIEGPKGINLSFAGTTSKGEVFVEVPSLKGIVKEGTYDTRLEVIVDDRIFVPLQLEALIKQSVKVEAAVRTSRKSKPTMVTASVLGSKKEKPVVETSVKNKTQKKVSQTAPKRTKNSVPELERLLKELETLK